jgi:ADP-ribose pyrophosphatase YjhB (NUDIX family)
MKWRLVVAAVIEDGDSILFGEKASGRGPYPDTIHIPGGGMDPETENIEEAIRREVREEAGIEICDLKKLDFDEDYEPNKHGEMTHYIYLVFTARYKSGELNATDDLARLMWIKKSDIRKQRLNRASIKTFTKLGYLN